MSAKKNILIGCSIVAAVGFLGLVALIGGCFYIAADPQGATVSVDCPTQARKDQVIELVVTVTNERPSKPFKVGDIDLQDVYLDGFVVVGTEPEHKSSTHVPLVKSHSYTFDVAIPPGQSRQFKFKLRGVEPGVYTGDLNVYEGMRSVTKLVETEVK